uniref:Uncharacterized protein n=1 Tax=Aegilops tauschii TaxID=37682 RepID=M8ANF2_AEGTA
MAGHDNELDEYGVVNNAIYVAYIHNAREELAASIGFRMASVARTGNAMALLELNLKYFKPLQVRIVQIKGARILVDHFIETLPDHKVHAQAIGIAQHERAVSFILIDLKHTLLINPTRTLVLVSSNGSLYWKRQRPSSAGYRPTRVFPEMSSKLHQFFSSKDS